MAEEEEEGEEGKAKTKKKLNLSPQLLLVLGNTVLVLAALGAAIYTKILYEKPTITETKELRKKQEESKSAGTPSQRPVVTFDQILINIAMTSGKSHYATIIMSLECRDGQAEVLARTKKDIITDRLITMLGKKQITELNTVQGKMLLKTTLIREFNTLLTPGSIVHIYFPNFVLQ